MLNISCSKLYDLLNTFINFNIKLHKILNIRCKRSVMVIFISLICFQTEIIYLKNINRVFKLICLNNNIVKIIIYKK